MKNSKLSKLLLGIQKSESSNNVSSSFEIISISNNLIQSQLGGVNRGCQNSGCSSGTNYNCTNTSCGNDTGNYNCTNKK